MSTGIKTDRAGCPQPIDVGVLADHWMGALAGPEEEAVELHLLECDRCGERLSDVIALALGIRGLAREARLQMVVTDAFLQRARENGLRVREYAPPAGGSVQCTVSADDDILIGRLAADLTEAGHVDLCICDERGVEHTRLHDIPFSAAADSVAFQPPMRFMRASGAMTLIARLVSVDDAGGERPLGEYTFNHTPS